MRIAGSASPCSTPTVYSPPVIQRSAITTGSSAEADAPGGGQLGRGRDAAHADARALGRGLDRERQAELCDRAIEIGGARELHPGRRRDARGLRKALGAKLVHADRGTEDAAAGIGQPHPLERALHRAVLAARSVQRDEHAVEAGRDELAERAFRRVEGGRVDAAR